MSRERANKRAQFPPPKLNPVTGVQWARPSTCAFNGGICVTSIVAILFDFDYTLADSSRGAIDCVGYALRELGLSPVSDEAARCTIGLSLPDTLVALAGPQPKAVSERFARLFVERADWVMAAKTVLLEAVAGSSRGLWSCRRCNGYRMYRRRGEDEV
jgi:hypothetical protein